MDHHTIIGLHSHTIHALLMAGIFAVQIAVAYAALRKYTETQNAPWLFVFLASSVFSAYSFLHALFVPDLILFNEALFDTFEHYGLFVGSAALFLGMALGTKREEYLYRFRHRIFWGWTVGNALFIVSFVFFPIVGEAVYGWIDYATGFSGVLFLLTSILFFRRFHAVGERLNLYTAIGLLVLVGSAVTPFWYEEWSLLWWSNHGMTLLGGMILLVGFLQDRRKGKAGDMETRISLYRRVSFKLTVLVLTITIMPLSVLGVYSFYISENALQKQAITDLEILVKSNDGHVTDFLYLLRRTASNFSSDGFIRRLLEEKDFESLSNYVVKNKLPLDPYLIGINIIDTKGIIVSSTHEEELGKDESSDGYFIEGMKLAYGESFITDYGKSTHFGTALPMVTTVAPLVSQDGSHTLGVIVAYFKLSDIASVLGEGAEKKETLDVYLVNKDNVLISRSRFAGEEAVLSQVVDTMPVTECREGRNTSGKWIDWRGIVVYGASICFTDFPFRWTLIAEISDQEVDQPAATLRDLIVVATLLLAVCAIFIALVSASRALDSLKRLSQFARKINQGDLDGNIDISSKDEVGELGKDLDVMRQAIKERENDLRVANSGLEETAHDLANKMIDVEDSKKAVLNLLEDLEEEKNKVEGVVVERTKELRDERARLLASINSLSFGFILADLNHRILLKNPALQKILQIPGDPKSIEEISKHFEAFGSKAVEFNLLDSCSQCIVLKKTLEIKELSYGGKYLRIFCAPISVGEGEVIEEKEIIGYVFLVEDITEAKVVERSREEFFSIASHELRTPLTAIRGNANMINEMYGDKIADAEVKAMLADIEISSIRLIDIVNDFLEVSRLEQGQSEMKKESFPLSEVIEKVVRDFKSTIEQKGVSLNFLGSAAKLPDVLADKSRVEQILINLIGNAAKFTKQGKITINIEVQEPFLKVRVADTGIGISEQNQALLFRKFQQAGESTLARDVTQGTGLGLYIARLLISKMGGTIGHEKTEMSKGSTFAFTLPIAEKLGKQMGVAMGGEEST